MVGLGYVDVFLLFNNCKHSCSGNVFQYFLSLFNFCIIYLFILFSLLLLVHQLFLEEIARDIQKADPEWRIILLRYFNPVGAHESGHIGEDPIGIPNNLMPYIQQVAVGRLPELNVYGYDYPTKDGSAVSTFTFLYCRYLLLFRFLLLFYCSV